MNWAIAIYGSCIRPSGVLELGSLGCIEDPFDITITTLNDTLVQVKLVIIEQTNKKSQAALDKKEKQSKVLSHDKTMILNTGSLDKKVQAVAPTKAILEIM